MDYSNHVKTKGKNVPDEESQVFCLMFMDGIEKSRHLTLDVKISEKYKVQLARLLENVQYTMTDPPANINNYLACDWFSFRCQRMLR
jgi:hypothetical protein